MLLLACRGTLPDRLGPALPPSPRSWDTRRRDLLSENIDRPESVAHESEAHYHGGLLRRLAGVSHRCELVTRFVPAAVVLLAAWAGPADHWSAPLACAARPGPQVRGYPHILPDVGVPKGEHAHS
jgi:hypothetical protein